MSNNNYVLSCINLNKSYQQGETVLDILTGINLQVALGETVSIMGSSGSGKSTLLHILAGLDSASSGEVSIDGHIINKLNDNQICQIRNNSLGFIYQFHHLLSEFSAIENVLMPVVIRGMADKNSRKHAIDLLGRLGLGKRIEHFPGQLSGGERQRVAIARAVVNNPKLVFADEPTGNLDNTTSNQVLDIFFQLQNELKTSLVMVTHDPQVAAKTSVHYLLHAGVLTLV